MLKIDDLKEGRYKFLQLLQIRNFFIYFGSIDESDEMILMSVLLSQGLALKNEKPAIIGKRHRVVGMGFCSVMLGQSSLHKLLNIQFEACPKPFGLGLDRDHFKAWADQMLETGAFHSINTFSYGYKAQAVLIMPILKQAVEKQTSVRQARA